MGKLKQGVSSILLFRALKDARSEGAFVTAFQSEHEIAMSRNVDGIVTKAGIVQNIGAVEYDFSAVVFVSESDTDKIKKLKRIFLDGDIIEIWEVDRAEKGSGKNSGKYAATYFQGFIKDFTQKSSAEDSVELELEFAINGVGQDGFATLTDEQVEVVQYVFKDTSVETDSGLGV